MSDDKSTEAIIAVGETTGESQVFEINEETQQSIETGLDTSGMLPEEIELAKEHGIKIEGKDNEHEKQPEPKTKEDTGEQEEKIEEEVEDTLPTFDEVENDESLAEKYNPNEKALYWKWKGDKKKRQDAQKQYDELKATVDLNTIKENVSARKLNEIKSALGKEDLTVEMLQSIIEGQLDAESDKTPHTMGDLKKIEQDKQNEAQKHRDKEIERNQRILTTEKVGRAKYNNFDDIVVLAQEIVDADKTKTYSEVLLTAIEDGDTSEEALVDRVVTIAKLNPKFGELTKSVKSEDKDNVDRAIKNSKKKISSAAVGTGSGKRMVNEDELTPNDAVKMSVEQWSKLKPDTKKRLLMG